MSRRSTPSALGALLGAQPKCAVCFVEGVSETVHDHAQMPRLAGKPAVHLGAAALLLQSTRGHGAASPKHQPFPSAMCLSASAAPLSSLHPVTANSPDRPCPRMTQKLAGIGSETCTVRMRRLPGICHMISGVTSLLHASKWSGCRRKPPNQDNLSSIFASLRCKHHEALQKPMV